jgi:hypothetical protein
MDSLLDKILSNVISSAKSLVIAADEDDLFNYPDVIQALENEQLKILRADNNLDVRIKFELQMRHETGRILLVAPPDYVPLPDIEEIVHFLKIGFHELFPRLSSKVIKGLSFSSLERLFQVRQYENLGDEKTLETVFETIYQINLESLKRVGSRELFLSDLITIFLEDDDVNDAVVDALTPLAAGHFPDITTSILSRNELIKFLQHKWEAYINGSAEIDFRNFQLQKSINQLFAVGELTALKTSQEIFNSNVKSFPLGVSSDKNENVNEKLSGILKHLEEVKNMPETHEQWFAMMPVLSNGMLASFETSDEELQKQFSNICHYINQSFQNFVETKYDQLFSLSGAKRPAVVSRILEHIKFNTAPKKALFVIDGINFWQWQIIAERLNEADIQDKSGVTCAYIPTITAWSRQAIFRGAPPDLSMNNSKEEQLFRDYWKAHGYQNYQIGFNRINLTDPSANLDIADSVEVLGIVTNDLDEMMHGAFIGNIHLKQSTELWLEKSSFINQIKRLKLSGYKIFITTDHGSVEATGIKNLKLVDKVGAIKRSKRHIHFANENMLANFLEQNSTLDLGTRNTSVFLKNTEAFTTESALVVTHGGSHFWEVLVPFIEI